MEDLSSCGRSARHARGLRSEGIFQKRDLAVAVRMEKKIVEFGMATFGRPFVRIVMIGKVG